MLLIDSFNCIAQSTDTAKNVNIDLTARTIIYTKTDSSEINRFIGDAVFIQGTDTLYCDSLYENVKTKNIEAFGNVRIRQQGGTKGQSDYLRYTSNAKVAYMKDNVSLTDGKNVLKCKELTYYLNSKTGEYYNGGTLFTDSTTVTSLEGEYQVKEKFARFKKHVVVTDVRYNIVSQDLGYATENKVVTFYSPSTVTADSGKSIIKTTDGTYDSKTGTAFLVAHSYVYNEDHYLEGDTIYYNKITGFGYADGHVISIDTSHHSTMYCGHADYHRKERILWATIKPVLRQINGKDTLYVRADTFYSFPAPKDIKKVKSKPKGENIRVALPDTVTAILADKVKVDSVNYKSDGANVIAGNKMGKIIPKNILNVDSTNILTKSPLEAKTVAVDSSNFLKKNLDSVKAEISVVENSLNPALVSLNSQKEAKSKKTVQKKSIAKATKRSSKKQVFTGNKGYIKKDTTAVDTTAPLFFVGYHHVRIFSDSLQGLCDSISYSQADSTVRMICNPIVWSHLSQITGDTILLRMDDSGHLKTMYVPNNAFVASQSGPEKAQLFDQVQGKTLTGYFEKNNIKRMLVKPDCEAIYYSKDSKGAYVGLSEAKSELMRIFFENQEINKIKFEKDITHTLTPMEKADIKNARLSRFKWLFDKRPKSKQELFE